MANEKERVSLTLTTDQVQWLDSEVARTESSRSEVVALFIAAARKATECAVEAPDMAPQLKELRAAIECLAHRYMLDHPIEGKTADQRLVAYRQRYEQVAKSMTDA
jgi:hypothetical protein